MVQLVKKSYSVTDLLLFEIYITKDEVCEVRPYHHYVKRASHPIY
jgi:hypothetical protein